MASSVTSTAANSAATEDISIPTPSPLETTPARTLKRLGHTSPSTSVICEEVFDDAYPPSTEEICEYASLIGIDPIKEPHLLYLAKEGLMAAMPSDWKICYSEEKSGHYYYNTRTKQSQWDHPLDAVYRDLVHQTRQKTIGGSTPIIDNSDDVSQLDSGIRSMQGTDELVDDMSSALNNGGGHVQKTTISIPATVSTTLGTTSPSCSVAPSSFSGGVSRFLESRNKNFGGIFQMVKNSRFEVAKTNAQINLAMKFHAPEQSDQLLDHQQGTIEIQSEESGGFHLTGTGAMFLKSRRQLDKPTVNAVAPVNDGVSDNRIFGDFLSSSPGVKGILRDSSLTDMRRRLERNETALTETEDKKIVRFNLEETQRLRSSPEEDASGGSARKLTQSPELSINSDDVVDDDDAEGADDVEEDDDDDVWDEDGIDPDAMEGMCSLNPFITNDPNKPVRIINLPKAQTMQMLKTLPTMDKAGALDLGGTGSNGSYLDKLKENSTVKPLYEDTDSDSKGSSVRSFIINKSDQDSMHSSNPFDLHELGRQHKNEMDQLQRKLHQQLQPQGVSSLTTEKLGGCSLKIASKLVGLLKQKDNTGQSIDPVDPKSTVQLDEETDIIKREYDEKLKSMRHEYNLRLASHRHQLEEAYEQQLDESRAQMEQQLQAKRSLVINDHKARMATLQTNHTEIVQELERDLRSEEEILRREHTAKLAQMRDKFRQELEHEKQRLLETGEERLYEKVRCEKRLLEDKYRCLKEKYVRLKTDVKLSLERRNQRREAQALQQHTNTNTNTTTGSETERSISNKPSIGNSENRSLSYSEQVAAGGSKNAPVGKPPVPPKTHLCKPSIGSKYSKQLQLQDDNTTSISQSDTTMSNNYSKRRYLPGPTSGGGLGTLLSDNGNSDSEAAMQCNLENNNNNSNKSGPRKKLFSRTKSASTSRLNSAEPNYKQHQQHFLDRSCTPVESLRHQLQKLEDLEDQFPDHTLDITYHLRYPFTDISNEHAIGVGSELEFFKHRIHLERDSVRRAKESLRTQRTNFRERQREMKQRHKAFNLLLAPRHTLDQLIQEEKELTEMEVNLHRTRALLGEKVIRLRHLEQSLSRIYEKEKPTVEVEVKDDTTTLSDLSSHTSSGFSSTDFASGADLHKRKEYFQQESNDCIQSLETLNAEICEVLKILSQKQQKQQPQTPLTQRHTMPMISPNDLSWSNFLSHPGTVTADVTMQINTSTHSTSSAGSAVLHAPQSIPTLADRLETYRHLAAGRMQSSMGGALLAANTIVSQSPRAVNYTTSLVERTRDLRNWLRQAKTEHELLTGIQHGMTLHTAAEGGVGEVRAVHESAGGGAAAEGTALANSESQPQSNL
ncbi:uncharacterized protein LOC115629114 [Scaptodrosophila lebanonensis]|uniref:Uncharacterized protein LOC115629114 n=1 Tax=Drosophila lebanonensis TaxID=7225 RepID=A0A6J2U1G8_DROLE|nr:uncharacterized protein LOC115629114 [Scaptodrosophila lebanonensis]